MAKLRDNLDFVAILLLVAVLGVIEAPRFRPTVRTIRMEQPGSKLRIHHFDRLAHTIPYMR